MLKATDEACLMFLDSLDGGETWPLSEEGVELWAERITNRLDKEGYIKYDDGNFYFTSDLDTDYFWQVAQEEDPTSELEAGDDETKRKYIVEENK